MQSRKHSLLESLLNTASGMIISFLAAFLVYPMLGMKAGAAEYGIATAIYTVISVVRSYLWRRAGNWYTLRHAAKTSKSAIEEAP